MSRDSHQARPGASPEVPLQRSLAVPRCPVLPTSGRSRCGVSDRPASGPAGTTPLGKGSSVRDRWRRGPSPLRFSACARRDGRLSPAVTVRAPARPGHAPPLLHGRCSATRASRRTAWPVPPRGDTGGAPGVLPFAALLPPAGVAAFPPLGPTCRFPGASSRRAVAFYVSSGASVCLHPLGPRACRSLPPVAAPGLRPRGRCVPWRGVWVPAPRPLPPWALPLSGLSVAFLLIRVRRIGIGPCSLDR